MIIHITKQHEIYLDYNNCRIENRKIDNEKRQPSFVIELIISSWGNISEQKKNLVRITDSSLKHQLEEFQERLDDTTKIYPQKRGRVALEEANISQQIVDLQDQMSYSNATLQNVDAEEKKKEALLENSKGIDYVQCQLKAL